jgi:hypothetical protein
MNGRVIFFPLKFWQSEENLRELKAIQERLHYHRIAFLNSIKRESPWQQAIAHLRFRSFVKDSLKIISE